MSRPCAFLDRDGVINEKPAPHEYVRNWSEFRLLENVVDWIRLFNALGLLVIVVTNQRGVARGMMSAADVDDIHRKMTAQLASLGARIDDVFYCPHEAASCDCRKPKPGLVQMATKKWDVDLSVSIFVGDSAEDEQLAANCGLRFVRVEGGHIAAVSPS